MTDIAAFNPESWTLILFRHTEDKYPVVVGRYRQEREAIAAGYSAIGYNIANKPVPTARWWSMGSYESMSLPRSLFNTFTVIPGGAL